MLDALIKLFFNLRKKKVTSEEIQKGLEEFAKEPSITLSIYEDILNQFEQMFRGKSK